MAMCQSVCLSVASRYIAETAEQIELVFWRRELNYVKENSL